MSLRSLKSRKQDSDIANAIRMHTVEERTEEHAQTQNLTTEAPLCLPQPRLSSSSALGLLDPFLLKNGIYEEEKKPIN